VTGNQWRAVLLVLVLVVGVVVFVASVAAR
jgi:hypothetical protein